MATILLIEDDADLAHALSQSLTEAGHRVITALDGMSALNTLDTDVGIDLLLTDLIMPAGQPHGLALANMARQKRRDLVTILMTGHPELREQVNGHKVLLKPVRADIILDEIAASLSAAQR